MKDHFLTLAHLFGTVCLKNSATLFLLPLLKPPSRRTCLIIISKQFFTAMPIPSSNMQVCACGGVCAGVCVCYCKVTCAPTLCGRWVFWRSSLLLLLLVVVVVVVSCSPCQNSWDYTNPKITQHALKLVKVSVFIMLKLDTIWKKKNCND